MTLTAGRSIMPWRRPSHLLPIHNNTFGPDNQVYRRRRQILLIEDEQAHGWPVQNGHAVPFAEYLGLNAAQRQLGL